MICSWTLWVAAVARSDDCMQYQSSILEVVWFPVSCVDSKEWGRFSEVRQANAGVRFRCFMSCWNVVSFSVMFPELLSALFWTAFQSPPRRICAFSAFALVSCSSR